MAKTLVNLRMEEDQKERWEQAIEDTENYSSLSQLIRLSVEKEISDEFSTSPDQIQQQDIDLGAISSGFEEIHDRLDQIQQQIDSGQDSESRELVTDETEMVNRIYQSLKSMANNRAYGDGPIPVSHLERETDLSNVEFQNGLERLFDSYPDLQYDIQDGEAVVVYPEDFYEVKGDKVEIGFDDEEINWSDEDDEDE